MSLTPWLLESDRYAKKLLLRSYGFKSAAQSNFTKRLLWPLVSDNNQAEYNAPVQRLR